MPGQKLKDYLKSHEVKYESIIHPIAFTAHRTAHAAHIHGNEVVKTIILKVDGKMTMFVCSANERINMKLIKEAFKAKNVELANEEEFKFIFRDCETGAMPPFGNLYGMEEFVSEELTRDEEIAFNAGSHTELIKMKFDDFKKIAHPRVLKVHN